MLKPARIWVLSCSLLAAFACLASSGLFGASRAAAPARRPVARVADTPCASAQEHSLPLPSSLRPSQLFDFQKSLFAFLDSDSYETLHWCVDKGVRDTGPLCPDGVYHGTHPAVRIFYSPRMMHWLVGGRVGPVPDGAMIVKEQYRPPAASYAGLTPAQVTSKFASLGKDWTVMIKDSAGSHDGWYWTELFTGMTFDAYGPPFNVFNGGFGAYCLRCHGAAEKDYTFVTLDNIEGFPGVPLTFSPDDPVCGKTTLVHHDLNHPKGAEETAPPPPPKVNPLFLKYYGAIGRVPLSGVETIPGETYDHVVPPPGAPAKFLTSDQCMNCHGALNGPFGPTMFQVTGPPINDTPQGLNFSPYGEWRWSPMGLAGRDPVFYAQFESEIEYLKTIPDKSVSDADIRLLGNLCFRCHGVMGQRQLAADHPGEDFDSTVVLQTNVDDPTFKYGALARDGVSCAACHHIAPKTVGEPIATFLDESTTGLFGTGPDGELHGPFANDTIKPYIMKNALGVEPKASDYVRNSRLCGSCHTINLPILDAPPVAPVGPSTHFSMEQATYLEWLNSQYQTEFGDPTPRWRSCQDCHMPGDYSNANRGITIPSIQTKIAVVEDSAYPEATHRADKSLIDIPVVTSGFRRHELLGLNAFLLTMFQQFNDILGVRLPDYMSGSTSDLADAIGNVVEQAEQKTADVRLSSVKLAGRRLTASVTVENLAGHRFPSGVGFRRAFLELDVVEKKAGRDNVVWSSGRSNDVGILLDGNGNPLLSEFFVGKAYQPHYQKITRQDQVQIYEELTQNADGDFTTSFIRRDHAVKDNRLLPKGWSKSGPSPQIPFEYLKDTFPEGGAADDPDYADGSGTDTVAYELTLPDDVDPRRVIVRATLYYQAIPPYFLDMRFREAPNGPATRRLYALASHLDTTDSAVKGWKLRIGSASAALVQ